MFPWIQSVLIALPMRISFRWCWCDGTFLMISILGSPQFRGGSDDLWNQSVMIDRPRTFE
uniref:Uncharacterized protein n=1 Tax=Picea glauca TaxID=3330 RepID=A0A101M313_PICGL|nr:hypothetical protein ABT39_MTgene3190 [Picea glauca]KUM50736.1 hypothetical protein ABT39_MTgene580 [Picea glauca]